MAAVKYDKAWAVGAGDFPFDMLRYDRCWPNNADDAYHIDPANGHNWRAVELVRVRGGGGFTPRRWRSFTWALFDNETDARRAVAERVAPERV